MSVFCIVHSTIPSAVLMLVGRFILKMRLLLCLVLTISLCYAFNNNYSTAGLTNTVNGDCNCSVYDRSFQKVLNRNKRWFVFPKGCSALLTMVVTKTVLDGRPRGLQESMEMELGYSVPPWIEGWRSAQFFSNSVSPVKSAQKKVDDFSDNWNSQQWESNTNYGNNTGKTLGFEQFMPRYEYNKPSSNSLRQYPTTVSKQLVATRRNKDKRLRSWQYHREYRERRNIFQNFERLQKYLEMNVKACIMRAICEVKNGLLPKGESFIQDVARIIFTVPLDHEFEDDYVDSAKDAEVDCAKKFAITCPFNPVEYFQRNGLRLPVNWNKIDLS